MGANSDREDEENRVVAEAGEDVVDVTKGVLKAAADLVSKTGVVLLLIIIVGIVLLVIRDLIYQASAWSTTELVVIVAAWDAWSNCARPTACSQLLTNPTGSSTPTMPRPRSPEPGTRPVTPACSLRTVPGKSSCGRSRIDCRRPQGLWHQPRGFVLTQ